MEICIGGLLGLNDSYVYNVCHRKQHYLYMAGNCAFKESHPCRPSVAMLPYDPSFTFTNLECKFAETIVPYL